MNEDNGTNRENEESNFSRQVASQAKRKLKAQRGGPRSVWFGLGMSGLIGWSVSVPTLIGAAIGVWIDKHHPSHYSWTLMLLLIGLLIGCFNAWHWVDSEYKGIHEDNNE